MWSNWKTARPRPAPTCARVNGHANAIDFVVGRLLQPIPVKAKPHVSEHLVGSRVVRVEGSSER